MGPSRSASWAANCASSARIRSAHASAWARGNVLHDQAPAPANSGAHGGGSGRVVEPRPVHARPRAEAGVAPSDDPLQITRRRLVGAADSAVDVVGPCRGGLV